MSVSAFGEWLYGCAGWRSLTALSSPRRSADFTKDSATDSRASTHARRSESAALSSARPCKQIDLRAVEEALLSSRRAAALCRLVWIRQALGCRHGVRLIATAKDAALVVVMVQLRAAYRVGPLQPAV